MTSNTATSAELPFDRIVVVPGFGAGPGDHWFPWLTRTLSGVDVLELPDPLSPDARAWIPLVAEAIGRPDARTAVVTHSLGGLTTLRALQDVATPGGPRLGALVAVAPFAGALATIGDPDLDTFVAEPLSGFLDGLDLDAAASVVGACAVIRSDDDPIVPAVASDRFARAIGAEVGIVDGAGHFLAEDGVTQLSAVLGALKRAALS